MTDLPLLPTASISPARSETARRAVDAIFLVNGILYATWAVNIPSVRDGLGLTAAQVGLALLAVGLGSLASMPLMGGWTARFGSARVTRVAVVLAMLSLLPPLLAPNLATLVLTLAVMGAANGALDVAMNAQGVTVERRLSRPVMSRFHAYFSLGGVVGALLGTLLVGRVPLLAHGLLVVGATTLAGALAGRLLLPDLPDPQAAEARGGRSPARLSPAVLLLGALCFLGMLSEGANYDWAALYFRDVLGLAGGNSGIGYAAFVIAMTLGRWFGDAARARLGDERTVRAGALLTAAGLGLALLVRDPLPATLGFALSGLGLSNVVPVLYGTAGHALAGRGIAQVATIGYAGFLLGPPAIGFVAEHVGLPAALGLALAGAALVAALGGRAFILVRGRQGAGGA
ncbi:major facilitator superfamily transporter [Deinococcus aerius]|uniref:Major facilitator superfamily transporter n=1 Tax=Deinococcus aerius TaxID=200253 RepID=A0A2I9D900_9DEIO|nr:MFS transporter [Deinococcus aerius]GBF07336.1 major facilitator superfamily transporter [Deinococcus aerius]